MVSVESPLIKATIPIMQWDQMIAKTLSHSCKRVLLSDHHKKRILSERILVEINGKEETAVKFDLDGLVVIGRVESSTNACLLAENLGSSDREMPRSRGLIDKVIFRENDPLVILLERTVTVMVLCPNIQTKAQSEIDAPWSSKALLNITFKGTLQGNAYSGQDSHWSKFFWGIYQSTLHILRNHIAALCLAFLLGSLLP